MKVTFSTSSMPRVTRTLGATTAAVLFGVAAASAQSSAVTSTSIDDRRAQTTEARMSAPNQQQGELHFVAKAAKNNQKELAASQLALERASNDRVREFAQTIVEDHKKVGKELEQLAKQTGVDLKAHLKAGKSDVVAKLSDDRTASGSRAMGATVGGGSTAGAGPRVTEPGLSASVASGLDNEGRVQTSAAAAGGYEDGDPRMALVRSDDPAVQQLLQQRGADFDEHYIKLIVREHEKAVQLFERASQEADNAAVRRFASQHVDALRNHLEKARNIEQVVAE